MVSDSEKCESGRNWCVFFVSRMTDSLSAAEQSTAWICIWEHCLEHCLGHFPRRHIRARLTCRLGQWNLGVTRIWQSPILDDEIWVSKARRALIKMKKKVTSCDVRNKISGAKHSNENVFKIQWQRQQWQHHCSSSNTPIWRYISPRIALCPSASILRVVACTLNLIFKIILAIRNFDFTSWCFVNI